MGDRGVGCVGGDEDPVVRRAGLPRRRDARQAQPEPEAEQDPCRHETAPMQRQPSRRPADAARRHPLAAREVQAVTSVLWKAAPRQSPFDRTSTMVLTASWTPAIGPAGASSVPWPLATMTSSVTACGAHQVVADDTALVDAVEDGLMTTRDGGRAVMGDAADVDERGVALEGGAERRSVCVVPRLLQRRVERARDRLWINGHGWLRPSLFPLPAEAWQPTRPRRRSHHRRGRRGRCPTGRRRGRTAERCGNTPSLSMLCR